MSPLNALIQTRSRNQNWRGSSLAEDAEETTNFLQNLKALCQLVL